MNWKSVPITRKFILVVAIFIAILLTEAAEGRRGGGGRKGATGLFKNLQHRQIKYKIGIQLGRTVLQISTYFVVDYYTCNYKKLAASNTSKQAETPNLT